MTPRAVQIACFKLVMSVSIFINCNFWQTTVLDLKFEFVKETWVLVLQIYNRFCKTWS